MNHFDAIAALLNPHGLDAMLLTHEANRFYASGFHSTGTDGMALVLPGKAYYLTDSRYTEAAEKAIAGAEVLEVGNGRGYITLLTELLKKHQIKTLGFEEACMTVQEYMLYARKLPCKMLGASALMTKLRSVKSQEEREIMIAAQRIAEKSLADLLPSIKPGVTEKELAARIQYLMLHYGAEDMSFDPIVICGPNTSLPHGVPTERKVQTGDFVTMDIGCIYHGYCSDMTRTVAVGTPADDEMVHVYETVLAAQKAGIAAARAGVTGAAVDGAARKVIADAGYGPYFGHSFGHSLGVEIHESPNATPGNGEPLPCGAVISAEPGIYLPGRFGVRIEDVIFINEDGCEDITLAPKELTILR